MYPSEASARAGAIHANSTVSSYKCSQKSRRWMMWKRRESGRLAHREWSLRARTGRVSRVDIETSSACAQIGCFGYVSCFLSTPVFSASDYFKSTTIHLGCWWAAQLILLPFCGRRSCPEIWWTASRKTAVKERNDSANFDQDTSSPHLRLFEPPLQRFSIYSPWLLAAEAHSNLPSFIPSRQLRRLARVPRTDVA